MTQDILTVPSARHTRGTRTWRIGEVEVTRIDELTLDGSTPAAMYPGAGPASFERNLGQFGAGSLDPATGNLIQSIHTWLLRTPRHTILIDTATGNDKNRPTAPIFDHLDQPYLARLAAAGVRPEAVDFVLLTHLHADHVGWNTRLLDGRWVPTFPRARHVFSRIEQAYNEAIANGREPEGQARPGAALGRRVGTPLEGVYDDSVRPVIEAGLADMIDIDGSEFLDGLSFVRTPGHSIDHASIRLVSQGEEALFAGDVMHHPLQVAAPELASCYCQFPDAGTASRRWALEHAAERDATVFTTHFAETSAGRVTRAGDRFAWRFV